MAQAVGNPFKQLQNLVGKPPMIPADIANMKHLSSEDKQLLKKIGMTFQQLKTDILKDTQIQWDRQTMYQNVSRALNHWLVSSAMELYADYSTAFSSIHNASVWVTSESPTYARILNKFLQETVGIEERIFDWASATGGFGNLFVKLEGVPGQGIISIDDTQHPLNISRVDHKGLLVGFYQTPLGQYTGGQKLMSPWDWVHFRLLGAKKKRNPWGDESYSEFRSMYLLSGMNTLQATTRYGTSLLTNALPLYKRLRMAEDSLLLARLTRGITRYIWKLKVSGENLEAVGELVDQYATLVKRARALDTSALNPNYDSKANPMAVIEDLFVPVWGDTGDLTYDKVGGEANIRWIVDIEELRNQLACALRCPLSLLGGFVKEASGSLGSQAIEKLDIRFARSSRRLQRALRDGIKRMCQIHLAYMNMDPDPALFEVNMSETSTAEEESLRESLDAGVDTVRKMVEMLADAVPEIDQRKVITYLNHKILKLEDFDIEQFIKAEVPEAEAEELPPVEPIEGGEAELLGEAPPEEVEGQPILRRERKNNQITVYNTDVLSYLPVQPTTDTAKKLVENFKGWVGKERGKEVWEEKFGNVTVIEKIEGQEDKPGAQKTFKFS
jgi:hypothetical protein